MYQLVFPVRIHLSGPGAVPAHRAPILGMSWQVGIGRSAGGRGQLVGVSMGGSRCARNCGRPSTGPSYSLGFGQKGLFMKQVDQYARHKLNPCLGVTRNQVSTTISKDIEGFLLNAIDMNFFDRLSLAWKIVFPTTRARKSSDANIAKQRLKMVLFSDRCAVSDEAKQRIVSNVVTALSDFVEIDSEDKVQLTVSTDSGLGTVYSVTVPVRRVKPGYREGDEEYTGITGIEYKDTGEKSGSVDVTFDFFVPGEQ